MARQLLVGTRKGLFLVGRHGRDWRIERAELLGDPVTMAYAERTARCTRPGHGPLRRQAEALARRRRDVGRAAGAAVPAETRRRRRSRSDAQHADPVGHEARVGARRRRSAPASSGAARFRAASSARATAATAGNSSKAFGSHPDRKFWSAAAPTIRHPLDPRRPARPRRRQARRLVRRTLASTDGGERGTAKARACAPTTCRPIKRTSGAARTRTALAQCAAAPDHIWIQHHNGIFRSTDGGLTWTEITNAQPSVFGFPVVVHPADPRTAWFVPGTKDQWRYPGRRRARRLAHERRRRELRGAARRLAAAARVRRRLSPRPRHRCRWRYTRVRQHHRQSIRQRKLGRTLAKRQPLPAADLLRSIRKLSVAREPARNA